MPARFIISLDCEGKWGVADHLDRRVHQTLSEERLRTAYQGLLGLLDCYDVAATFAFVGLFAEPAAALARMADALDDFAVEFPDYLGAALDDLRGGSRDGWSGEWAVEVVQSARTTHEIAFHGVTHIPWDLMDEPAIAKEVALFRALTSPVTRSRTMVYPRNRVAHVDKLTKLGISGYRDRRPGSRMSNLLGEFNPLVQPEHSGPRAEPAAIPAGYFVNWQHGFRRLVPRGLSRQRAANLISAARANDGIVHFWLHPENVASAPATLERVEDILAIVARERDAGRCVVETQADYCDRIAAVRAPLGVVAA